MSNIAGWACFGLGVALLGASYSNIKKARRSRGWPFAPGEVIESDVEAIGRGEDSSWAHIFKYRYMAPDGIKTGRKLRFTPISRTHGGAMALVKKYPVGKVVKVFYDPSNPSRCVIERGGGLSLIALPIVALVFGAAGVVMLGWVNV